MQANPKIPAFPPRPVAKWHEGSDGDDCDEYAGAVQPFAAGEREPIVVRIVQMHPGGDTLEVSILSEVEAMSC
jgi:hypothetical protein